MPADLGLLQFLLPQVKGNDFAYGGHYERKRFIDELLSQQKEDRERERELFAMQKAREQQAMEMARLQERMARSEMFDQQSRGGPTRFNSFSSGAVSPINQALGDRQQEDWRRRGAMDSMFSRLR